MIRRFIIAFVVTVAAMIAFWAFQGRFSTPPMKKAEILRHLPLAV